jgi:5-methylcytosine-specific restriction protein B
MPTISDAVRKRLEEKHRQLDAAGDLLSRDRLEAYYARFAAVFGSDVLQSLDGEELLERMHAHGRQDSLVYWLEFKDDDEFPTTRFGGIAGGSSLKFGVYRRRETGAWTVGSPQEQLSISVDEAIAIARKHRDQLVAGARLLDSWADDISDEAYAKLQHRIEAVAPDVQDTAWGHKYFSLLAPERLDDYHVAAYQRFHLIKLGQLPPAVSGRYASAGRFVGLARDFKWPVNQLARVLNALDGRPYRYWRIGTTDRTEPRKYWPLMRDNRIVAVGWSEVGDLTALGSGADARDRLRQRLEEHYPSTPQNTGRTAQQLMHFWLTIQEGDLVLAADGGTILGVGRVMGPYRYKSGADFPHQRAVEWLDLGDWKLPEPEGLQSSVRELKKSPANLVALERRLMASAASPPVEPRVQEGGKPAQLSGIPGNIQRALERKGQVILYGPPGTGKTYWAESAARDLAAHHAFGRSYDALSTEEQHQVWSPHGDGLVRTCTFHPSYGYEDFLEAYRPETAGGTLTFQLREGLFKRLCRDAAAQRQRRYYLIIDEINRGDVPRIFGELLTVIEPSRRGWPIALPLSGEPFSVPPNVHLIGTMNTADRSIALLDTALRRRFAFFELMPDSSVLGDAVAGGIPLGPWLDSLNKRIRDTLGPDARNLQLGHSYLLQEGRPLTDLSRLRRALAEDVLPLLEEYCYDDWEKLERIVGRGLVQGAEQRLRWELFDPVREDEFVRALLSIDPDLAASRQAVSADEQAAGGPEDDEEEAGPRGER